MTSVVEDNRRVLIIDDNEAIHEDIRKILAPLSACHEKPGVLESSMFKNTRDSARTAYEIDSTLNGNDGVELVKVAVAEGHPYSVAFVDMRMPHGWNGLETTSRILNDDPDIAVVICSAYSDHDCSDLAATFGDTERVLVLKKPFAAIEVRQLAWMLQHRWMHAKRTALGLRVMENLVSSRTKELEHANAQLCEQAVKRERMEVELRLAQRLEAVGQLAAGIAHEINTPMQYIGDNVHFLRSALADYRSLLAVYREAAHTLEPTSETRAFLANVSRAEVDADLEYLEEHIPRALERTLHGVDRVSDIVRAMREFSHQGQRVKAPADINQAIENTLTVAHNEYKYVAEIATELDTIPLVTCYGADINQVFLNLIVNAAHAVAKTADGGVGKGKISVRTRQENDEIVLIEIADNGCGIPEALRQRVFDPFFTTKDVGQGTGYGLAMARSVVMDKHGGTLTLESDEGRGTTFFVRLPITGSASPENEGAG